MDQIAAILVVVGCSAAGGDCREIPVPTPVYASVTACETARPLALRFTTTDDPKVLSQCAPVREADLERHLSIDWAVNRAGVLNAEARTEAALVAER